MALTYKIWDFPNIAIQKQLFHAPGMAVEGGFTSGGARMTSPEPGGRAVLEMQVALQVQEWDSPISSWLMSKINSDIFKIKLVKTPQLIKSSVFSLDENIPWLIEDIYTQEIFDNDQMFDDDFALFATTTSLAGSKTFDVDIQSFGEFIKHGHVLGNGNHSYIVEDIEYNGTIATVTVNPPLRNSVKTGDLILMRPYFTGTISNGAEMRQMYESANVGHIQLNRMIFQEVVT